MGTMALTLPSSVTGATVVPLSWTSLARAIPGLVDYFAAPGGAYLVALAEARPGDRRLLAYSLSAGRPARKLLDVPSAPNPVVMTQWAKGRYVAAWSEVISGIRDHPLLPPRP